ncbi:TfoX/Sxy family protein [Salinibacterium sp. ZJ77]|uniref:TfoX/Sxy family protein n=1 Tax=Salinibacterium sp. ZJ77 TaxID=2708337 RepID=UPI00142435F2|nr:TfoX/Sxy family protein [Salinibacterium sp. ZJ77]
MSGVQQILVARLRDLLDGVGAVREVPMFGGRAFMLDDRMVVSAKQSGGLLVRVPPERHAELLGRPGAAQATIGADRTMGVGWIEVSHDDISEDADLEFWVDLAVTHRAAQA